MLNYPFRIRHTNHQNWRHEILPQQQRNRPHPRVQGGFLWLSCSISDLIMWNSLFKKSWTRSNSLWIRAEDSVALQQWVNTSCIGIKESVLPLSQLRHMVCNFSCFPCSSISRINDSFSVFLHLYASRKQVYRACMLFFHQQQDFYSCT